MSICRQIFKFVDNENLWHVIAIGFCFILGLSSVQYLMGQLQGTDSGVFSSVGYHLQKGYTLYVNIWDHKPLGIHLINRIFLSIFGNSFQSIRLGEMFLAITTLIMLYIGVFVATRNRLIAILAPFMFWSLLYTPTVLEGGNLTEEYGVIFVVMGVSCMLLQQGIKRSYVVAVDFLIGIFFSVSIFFKEVFIFSVLGWGLLWLLLLIVRHDKWSARLFSFISGLISVLILVCIYHLYHNAFFEWGDEILFNVAYSQLSRSGNTTFLDSIVLSLNTLFQVLLTNFKLCLTFIFACGVLTFKKTKTEKIIFCGLLICLILEIIGSTISGRRYPHYFMQIIPGFLFITLFSFFVIKKQLVNKFPYSQTFSAVIAFTVFVFSALPANLGLRLFSESKVVQDELALFINKNTKPSDRIWIADGSLARTYLNSQRTSASKYLYVFDHLWLPTMNGRSANSRLMGLFTDIVQNCPKLVVLTDDGKRDNKKLYFLFEWILQNYVEIESDLNVNGLQILALKKNNPCKIK